jgi:trafficking protein particle complex subunit 4
MSGTRFDDGSQGDKDVDFSGRASLLVSSSSSSSPVFSVWIVNKSGGLIFYKNYSDKNTLDINDTLRLASVWHSLHAISRTNSVSPVKKSSGIELLETSTFEFMVCSMKKAIGVERLLRRVYDVYADFAMKNPFYELEQPIQAELFEERVMIAVKSCRNANSGHYSGGGGGGGYASSLY